jgi:hypothetical protein
VVESTFRTNVGGPLAVTQAFLPLVQKSTNNPRVINVSTLMGSNALAKPVFEMTKLMSTSYQVSKAALNLLTTQQSVSIPGVTFVALHPGWVKTDMGTQNAPLEVGDAVQKIVAAIESRKPSDNGAATRRRTPPALAAAAAAAAAAVGCCWCAPTLLTSAVACSLMLCVFVTVLVQVSSGTRSRARSSPIEAAPRPSAGATRSHRVPSRSTTPRGALMRGKLGWQSAIGLCCFFVSPLFCFVSPPCPATPPSSAPAAVQLRGVCESGWR